MRGQCGGAALIAASLTAWGLTGWLLLGAWASGLLALVALAAACVVVLGATIDGRALAKRGDVAALAVAGLMATAAGIWLMVAAWPLLSLAAAAIGPSPL